MCSLAVTPGLTGLTFAWSCTRATSLLPCFAGSELSSSSSIVVVAATSLVNTAATGGDYVITLTVTKSSRTAVATVRITTSTVAVPTVTIQSFPTFVTPDTRVVLRGAAVLPGDNHVAVLIVSALPLARCFTTNMSVAAPSDAERFMLARFSSTSAPTVAV